VVTSNPAPFPPDVLQASAAITPDHYTASATGGGFTAPASEGFLLSLYHVGVVNGDSFAAWRTEQSADGLSGWTLVPGTDLPASSTPDTVRTAAAFYSQPHLRVVMTLTGDDQDLFASSAVVFPIST